MSTKIDNSSVWSWIEEDNKALVSDWIEESNKGRKAVIDKFISIRYAHHDPAFPKVRNFKDFSQWFTKDNTEFDISVGVKGDMFAERDRVVAHLTWRKTPRQQGNIPSTNKEMTFTTVSVFRIASHKIVEFWLDEAGNREKNRYLRWLPSVVLYGFIPFGTLAIIIAHITLSSTLKIDAITLGLLVIAISPWLPKLLESAKLPGGWEITFRKLEDKVQDQEAKITSLQNKIKNHVTYSMSWSIFVHLVGIGCMYKYIYKNDEQNRREMYFLRDNNLIKPKPSISFLVFDDNLHDKNLVDMAEPTEIGWEAITLRSADARIFLAEGKDNVDLVDLSNVRVDPATAAPLRR